MLHAQWWGCCTCCTYIHAGSGLAAAARQCEEVGQQHAAKGAGSCWCTGTAAATRGEFQADTPCWGCCGLTGWCCVCCTVAAQLERVSLGWSFGRHTPHQWVCAGSSVLRQSAACRQPLLLAHYCVCIDCACSVPCGTSPMPVYAAVIVGHSAALAAAVAACTTSLSMLAARRAAQRLAARQWRTWFLRTLHYWRCGPFGLG